ncbi:MAG: hypothetical protein RBQ97_01835 [Acholeplasma sp.]|nr:hypothetical protein [Acholeplasma sp.]
MRNKLKRFFALSLVFVFALTLFACKDKDEDSKDLVKAKEFLTYELILDKNPSSNEVTKDLKLVTVAEGFTVEWSSNNIEAVSATGVVTQQTKDVLVVLTAKLTK